MIAVCADGPQLAACLCTLTGQPVQMIHCGYEPD